MLNVCHWHAAPLAAVAKCDVSMSTWLVARGNTKCLPPAAILHTEASIAQMFPDQNHVDASGSPVETGDDGLSADTVRRQAVCTDAGTAAWGA